MALTAEQEAVAVELEATVAELKAGIKQIEDEVSGSLSLRNMGGGFLINYAIDLGKQIAKAEAKLAELRTVEPVVEG